MASTFGQTGQAAFTDIKEGPGCRQELDIYGKEPDIPFLKEEACCIILVEDSHLPAKNLQVCSGVNSQARLPRHKFSPEMAWEIGAITILFFAWT
jgi:hypothetical protein